MDSARHWNIRVYWLFANLATRFGPKQPVWAENLSHVTDLNGRCAQSNGVTNFRFCATLDPMETPPNRHKVVALLRVSTKEQDIARQQADIEWNCTRFGLEVVETFALEGISGAVVQNRPEFRRMLSMLSRPTITGVVLSSLDRFLRPEDIDAYATFKIFRVAKKLLYCDAKRPLDVRDSEDRATIITQLENAKAERDRIKFRTHRAKELLIKDPETSMTRLPKGVEHIKDTKKYGAKTKKGYFTYTAYAYETVKPAFERFVCGESLGTVSADLGFPSIPTLRNTLRNKWWLGINERTHSRKIEYDDDGKKIYFPRTTNQTPVSHRTNLADNPLVSVEMFTRVQDLLEQNHKSWTQRRSYENAALGVGLFYCKCGCKMYFKVERHPVYKCSSYTKPEGPCGKPRVRAIETDETVWRAAYQYLTDTRFLVVAVKGAMESTESKERQSNLEAAKTRLEALEKQKRNIQKMVAVDDDDEDALRMYTKVKADIAEAKIRLATAEIQAAPFGTDEPEEIARAILTRFEGSENWTNEQKRQALNDVVERIMINDSGNATFVVRGGLPLMYQPTYSRGKDGGVPYQDTWGTPDGKAAQVGKIIKSAKIDSSSSRTSWTRG